MYPAPPVTMIFMLAAACDERGIKATFGFVHAEPSRVSFVTFTEGFAGAGFAADAHVALGFQWMFWQFVVLAVVVNHFGIPIQHGVVTHAVVGRGFFFCHLCTHVTLVCPDAVDPDVVGHEDGFQGLNFV